MTALIVAASLAPAAGAGAASFPVEMDGNLADDSGPGAPFDWASILGAPPADGVVASALIPDFATPDITYHQTGDRDTQDFASWRCAPRSSPQAKTDIRNVYAALVRSETGARLNFGFERVSNHGDASMGFWFLQRPTACVGPAHGKATFSGAHVAGDLLVLADFTLGGSVGSVRVLAWDPTVDGNLREVRAGADCALAVDPPAVCGVLNAAPVAVPWAPGGTLGPNQLFEGSLNLAAIHGASAPCFASFLAETRASQEIRAELKDFVVGGFSSCGLRVRLEPPAASGHVGELRTLTALVDLDRGSGWAPVAGASVSLASLGGPGTVDVGACTTDGAGRCALAASAAREGVSVLEATTRLTIGSTDLVAAGSSTQTWIRAPSATAVAARPPLALVGDPVVGEAFVSGALGEATGPVSLFLCAPAELVGDACPAGGAFLGESELVAGVASATAVADATGRWCFRAEYGGDARHAPSADATGCFRAVAPLSSLAKSARLLPDGAPGSSIEARPGDLVEWALVYENRGDGVARTVVLTDAVPAGARLVTCGCEASGETPGSALAWRLGDVQPGERRAVALVARLDAAFPTGTTPVPNVAHASVDGGSAVASEPVTVRVTAGSIPSLAAEVRALPDGAFGTTATTRPGRLLEYRLTYSNLGDADAHDVALAALLPAELAFEACTGGCLLDGATIRWTLGTVPAGASRSVLLEARAAIDVPAGSTVVEAVATATTRAAGAVEARPLATILAAPASAVALEARALPDGAFAASADAAPGGAVELRTAYRNVGDAPAEAVQVTLAVPAGASFAGCEPACILEAGVVRWAFPRVAPSEAVVALLRLALDPVFPAGTTALPAVAHATIGADAPVPSNVALVLVEAAPRLSAALTAEPPGGGAPATSVDAAPGDLVRLAIALGNDGDAPAEGVVVRLTLPSFVSVVACGGCLVAGGTVEWSVGSLAPGAPRTLVLDVRLDPVFPAGTSTLAFVPVVASGGAPGAPGAGATVVVVAAPRLAADLAVRLLPDGAFATGASARPGDAVAYRLLLANAGNADAASWRAVVPLPERASLLRCDACRIEGGAVVVDGGALRVGAQAAALFELRLDATFPAGETALVTSALASAPGAPSVGSNAATVTVRAAPLSSLEVAARVLPAGAPGVLVPATPGDRVEFVLTYRNSGSADAHLVEVADDVPARTTFESCAACEMSGGTVRAKLGTVAAGETRVVTWTAVLDAVFPAGTTAVANGATAWTLEETTVASNTATLLVSAWPATTFEVAPSAVDARPGERVELTLLVTNRGNAPASGVVADLVLPAGAALATCCFPAQVGALIPGETRALPFAVRLDAVFPAGRTPLVVDGAVSSAEEGRVVGSPAIVTVSALPRSSILVAVRAVPDGAFAPAVDTRPGAAVEVALSYRNDGDAAADRALVRAAIPARATVEACAPACALDAGRAAWELGSVPVGSSAELRMTLRLADAFPAGVTVLPATAEATSAFEAPVPSNEAAVRVLAAPATTLSLVARTLPDGLAADRTEARRGDLVDLVLVVANAGDAPATSLALSIALPERVAFVACDAGCSPAGGVLGWTLVDLDARATRAVAAQVRVEGAFPAGVTTLVATASGSNAEEGALRPDDAAVLVRASPATTVDLALRTLPDAAFGVTADARPFHEVEARLVVRNLGDAAASALSLASAAPPRATVTACDACATNGRDVAWALAPLAPGEALTVSFRFRLDPVFPAGTTLLPVAATASTPEEGAVRSNDALVAVLASPATTVTLDVRRLPEGPFAPQADAVPADLVELRVVASNDGDADANDLAISLVVPPKASVVACDGCSLAGGVARWNAPTLSAGGATTRLLTLRLDPVFPAGRTGLVAVALFSTFEEASSSSNQAWVYVTAAPKLEIVVEARRADGVYGPVAEVRPRETADVRMTVTNTGNAVATAVILRNVVPATTTLVSCPAPCRFPSVAAGSPLTFEVGSVDVGASKSGRFGVRFGPLYDGGETRIPTIATAESRDVAQPVSAGADLLVFATPDLGIVKSTSEIDARLRSTLTFSLAWHNVGDGHALDAVVRDALPPGTSFVSCEGGCALVGSEIVWNVGRVPAGTTAATPAGSASLVVRFDEVRECRVCNTATIDSEAQPGGPVPSNEVCLAIGPDPERAVASGSAQALTMTTGVLGHTASPVATIQRGPGLAYQRNAASADELPPFPVPPNPLGETIASYRVVSATSRSSVEASPARATQSSYAELLHVELLDGAIRADVVRGAAYAEALPLSSGYSAAGSVVQGLKINANPYDDVKPGTRIDLPPELAGAGSFLVVVERLGNTTTPPDLLNGTFEADLEVVALRVHLRDVSPQSPGNQTVEILVGRAQAHAEFPRLPVCVAPPEAGVLANAAVLVGEPLARNATVHAGTSSIPATGGTDDAVHAGVGGLVGSEARTGGSFATGKPSAVGATADARASAESVCLVKSGPGCAVEARAVRARVTAAAGPAGASATGGAEFVGLVVNGAAFAVAPDPGTVRELPGVGYVVLNEQIAGAQPEGGARLLVRAMRLVVTNPDLGDLWGAVVVVGEAEAGAWWMAAS